MKKQETPKRQSGARGSIPTPTQRREQMASAKIPASLASLIKSLKEDGGYDMKKSFICDAFAMWARAVEQYDTITADEQATLQAISEYSELIDELSKVEL